MITVEGLGGKRTVWVTWQTPSAAVMSDVPTSITAYCPVRADISPVVPTSMYLPPVGSTAVWYSTLFTEYGGRVSTIETGAIIGKQGDHTLPNPCQHTTATGLCLAVGDADVSIRPKWFYVGEPYSGIKYREDGTRLSMMATTPTTLSEKKMYNHLGEKVTLAATTANKLLWYTPMIHYPDALSASFSSSTMPYARPKHGDWLWSKKPQYENFYAFTGTRHTWEHVSENVWIEHWWQEYHSDNSYVPLTPLAWSGYGHVVAAIHRKRTHSLKFVQQYSPGFFQGSFLINEEVEFWGHKAQAPVAEYYDSGGTLTSSYTATVTLQTIEPGLCTGTETSLPLLDNYCLAAERRARILYSKHKMRDARSNAISDVEALDSNWIENLSQVSGTMRVVTPLLTGLAAWKTGDMRLARKTLQEAYLTYCYVIAPTLRDSKDLRDNSQRIVANITKYRYSNERRRGAVHVTFPIFGVSALSSYYCTYHFVLKDDTFSTIWNALERLNLDPSEANLWDLIPFSFVADWFLGVGQALERISLYKSSVAVRNLKHRIQSFKVQWPIPEGERDGLFPASLRICGDITYSWYDRRISNRIGDFNPFSGQSSDGLSVSQSAQGIALLSSYITR